MSRNAEKRYIENERDKCDERSQRRAKCHEDSSCTMVFRTTDAEYYGEARQAGSNGM
jgi:hypothetical protein